jgi:hypothetical protein
VIKYPYIPAWMPVQHCGMPEDRDIIGKSYTRAIKREHRTPQEKG